MTFYEEGGLSLLPAGLSVQDLGVLEGVRMRVRVKILHCVYRGTLEQGRLITNR